MVATIKLLNQYDKLKAQAVSVDKLWQHSTEVAQTARQLALAETGDRDLAEMAFTAGLMHDLGKVVLAANFDDQYHGALLLGAKNGVRAWDVEQDVFGANHGEVGAYLLGLWGLPLPVLEATALHHTPSRSANRGFTALTAVHVANVLERELKPDELGMPAAKLDEGYLEETGLLWRVEIWRDAVTKHDFTKVSAKLKPAQNLSMKTTPDDPTPKQTAEETSRKPGGLEPAGWGESWHMWAAAVAGIVLLAAAGVLFKMQSKQLEKPTTGEQERVAPMPRNVEPRPAVAPQVNKQVVGSPVAEVQGPKPGEAGVETMLQTVQARARTENPNEKQLPLADFKLQGIAYGTNNPSALINGENVRLNERISGARVVEITATSVTLELQGERRTLTLKPK
jgi:putative nucleotidyltransferase with HDIG domain